VSFLIARAAPVSILSQRCLIAICPSAATDAWIITGQIKTIIISQAQGTLSARSRGARGHYAALSRARNLQRDNARQVARIAPGRAAEPTRLSERNNSLEHK